MTRWQVDKQFGDAVSLFRTASYGLSESRITFCQVSRPALVLGSTQKSSTLCWEEIIASGLQVVRRKSGGGGVLIIPDQQVWVEVWVPRGNSLWQEDILKAVAWLGSAWAYSLIDLGMTKVSIHRGRMIRTHWSEQICFAGLGPGEVSIDGGKTVGIAQRRTREGTMFECSALLHFDPGKTASLMIPEEENRREVLAYLEKRVRPAGPGITPKDLEESFVNQITKL